MHSVRSEMHRYPLGFAECTSPVNHQLIAGFMLDMHGKLVLCDIVLI